MINTKGAIILILRLLKQNDLPQSKIVLHKFLFFLDTQGIHTGLRFEPWTYGPFSFDLAKILDDMVFWDEIRKRDNSFEIEDDANISHLDDTTEQRINELLHSFYEIVGDFTFDNLECIGTALYCAVSLSFQGEAVDKNKIITEFKAWKGNKYPNDKIEDAFTKLKPYLQ